MNDLELRSLLQELAGVRADGEPVVSAYLDTRWPDEQQRERARLFLREEAKRELDAHSEIPQLVALRRTLDRVLAEAGARVGQPGEWTAKGLAIFACESLGLWRVVELAKGAGSRLCTGMRPQLLPLARLLDDVEPAVVAVVHASGARVYELALGGIVGEATIEGPVPRAPKGGYEPHAGLGRRQAPGDVGAAGRVLYERSEASQRHFKQIVERNLAAAASFLVQRFDRHPTHVVLVGPREKTAALERELPQRVRERIVGRRPEPPGAGRGEPGVREEILAQALAAVAAKEREQEARDVEHAIGQARRGGLAVLGPDEVVLAVNERRVHRLILEDDFARSGWLCRNCDALGVTHAERCAYCEGDLAWVKELGEEIAGRVLADDGEVEIVPHDRRLHAYHGVAALLRQARAGFGASEARV